MLVAIPDIISQLFIYTPYNPRRLYLLFFVWELHHDR